MNFTLRLKYPFTRTVLLYNIILLSCLRFRWYFSYWNIIITNITVFAYNKHAMVLPVCVLNSLLWNGSDRVTNGNIIFPTYIIALLLICMPTAFGYFYRRCANNTWLRVSTHQPRARTPTLTDGTFDASMFAFSSSGEAHMYRYLYHLGLDSESNYEYFDVVYTYDDICTWYTTCPLVCMDAEACPGSKCTTGPVIHFFIYIPR